MAEQEERTEIDSGEVPGRRGDPPLCSSVTPHSTELCAKHQKEVDFYCADHDAIVCSVCTTIDHRTCVSVCYLPTSIHEVFQDKDFTKVQIEVKDTIEKLSGVKLDQETALSVLEKNKEDIFEELGNCHKRLIERLNQIAENSKKEINDAFEKIKVKLEEHHYNIETCLTDLHAKQTNLLSSFDNAIHKFVTMKKCQKQLYALQKKLDDAKLPISDLGISLDNRVEQLLDEMQSLVQVVARVNLSVNSDKKVCDVHGSCFLPNGSILLTDWSNKMLKVLHSQTLMVADKLLLKENPIDVCIISNQEAVVTLSNKTVLFVAFTPILQPIRSLTFQHHCAYIAYCGENLFVTDTSKQVYIYTMDGSLVENISTNEFGQDLFSRTRHITACKGGQEIWVADMDNGVLIIDTKTKQVVRSARDAVTGAFGICMKGGEGMFVCGYTSNNVCYISTESRPGSMLLGAKDGIKQPRSLCYNAFNKTLAISQAVSNELLIYHV